MKRKSPSPPFRLPVDFGNEPIVPLAVHDLRLTRGKSRRSPSMTNNACVLDCGGKRSATPLLVERPFSVAVPQTSQLHKTNDSFPLSQRERAGVRENHPSQNSAPIQGEGGLNHNSKFNSHGFTLIEILVVLVLLSLIVFALMAVFSGTQRAFRAGLTYADTQQSGRTVMDLIASDLASATPSYCPSNFFFNSSSNSPVNLFISGLQFSQPYPPTPLFQNLITSPSGALVTNNLENIYILSKNNLNGVPTWIGSGYSVNSSLPDGTLYPLYHFYMTTNVSSGAAGLAQMFNDFCYFQYANSNLWSHLMDGVVRLTATTYDTNGVWMTNGYANPQNSSFTIPSSFHVRSVLFNQDNFDPGVTDCVFYSNALPASVQIELGTLEDRTLQHAESLVGANQSNYLVGAAGQVHLFRQRVMVRNLDPTAYQQ